ncbi:MAG: hypothetical protein Aurels2KO_47180 [Aureliella sp.]
MDTTLVHSRQLPQVNPVNPPVRLSNQVLADHYADAYHRGECDNVNFASEGVDDESKCAIRVELEIDSGTINQAWFDSDGCPVCESVASIAMEAVEGKSTEHVASMTLDGLLATYAGDQSTASADTAHSCCASLPIRILQRALTTPLDALDDDLADGTSFGGPSLREEC